MMLQLSSFMMFNNCSCQKEEWGCWHWRRATNSQLYSCRGAGIRPELDR